MTRSLPARLLPGLLVLAVSAACASSDDDGATTIETPATASTTVAPTTTVAAATTTTTTEPAGPSLAERFTRIELSARLVGADGSRVVALAVSDGLDAVVDPGDPTAAPAWCTPLLTPTDAPIGAPFTVRISEPAVDQADGGLTGFELTVDHTADDPPGPGTVPASVEIELDGEARRSVSATLTLGDTAAGEAATGVFRAEFDDGTVLEGAYRCV